MVNQEAEGLRSLNHGAVALRNRVLNAKYLASIPRPLRHSILRLRSWQVSRRLALLFAGSIAFGFLAEGSARSDQG
jgi:hypothetical protein